MRIAWRSACWDPIAKRAPKDEQPPRSSHLIELGFDANGHEIARSIIDERGGSRVDVTVCLREQPFEPLRIAPPGTPVTLRLPLVFP